MAASSIDEAIEGVVAVFILAIVLFKILPSLMSEVQLQFPITLMLYLTVVVAIIGALAELWEELFG